MLSIGHSNSRQFTFFKSKVEHHLDAPLWWRGRAPFWRRWRDSNSRALIRCLLHFESMVGVGGWWHLVASVSVCGRRKGLDLCGFTGWSGLETWVVKNSPVERVFGMFVSWRLAGNESTLVQKDFCGSHSHLIY